MRLKLIFLSGVGLFLLMLVYQFKKPLLSTFKVSKGHLEKHEIKLSKSVDNEKVLLLWLTDTISKPFSTNLKGPQKDILRNLPFIKAYELTIWHNKKGEIMQLKANKTIIVDYDWFWPPYLFFCIVPFVLHYGMYSIVKKTSINVNSYLQMWSYALGDKELIYKHNYRKYKDSDSFPDSIGYRPIFVSKNSLDSLSKDQIIAWHQFFNICNAHAIHPIVRKWMSQHTKGVEFIQGFDFYEQLIKSNISSRKLAETTDSIFDFMSLRLDEEREHYNDFGKIFRKKFPKEYYKILVELNKLR